MIYTYETGTGEVEYKITAQTDEQAIDFVISEMNFDFKKHGFIDSGIHFLEPKRMRKIELFELYIQNAFYETSNVELEEIRKSKVMIRNESKNY